MYLNSYLTRETCFQEKVVAIFVISSCLFFIAGLEIVICNKDFSDTYDNPFITLELPIFFYHPNKQVTFLTLISELNVHFLKNSLPIFIRAPPL